MQVIKQTEHGRSFDIHINNAKIKNSNEVTLLRIKIDKNLTFKKHISELCRRALYKLYTLRRIRKYLTLRRQNYLQIPLLTVNLTVSLEVNHK